MTKAWTRLLLFLVLLGTIAAGSIAFWQHQRAAARPCLYKGSKYQTSYLGLLNRWHDAHALSQLSRGQAVLVVVEQFQAIRRDLESIKPPPCALLLQARTLEAMQAEIDVNLGTMAAGENWDALQRVVRADAEKSRLWNEVVELLTAAGLPPSKPS